MLNFVDSYFHKQTFFPSITKTHNYTENIPMLKANKTIVKVF